MSTFAANPYGRQAVGTASPAHLVTMLFDGALGSLEAARHASALQGLDRIQGVNAALQKAQAIVTELRTSLNHTAGGEIAANLDQLYGFCLDRLVQANVSKDLHQIAPVTIILSELREAWVGASAEMGTLA